MISRTLTYGEPKTYSQPRYIHSEPYYIQNGSIFEIRSIFRTLSQTFTVKRFAKIVNGCNYFRKFFFFRSVSLPRSPLHEINIMGQLLQRYLCYVKNYSIARKGAGNLKRFIYLLIY